MANALVPVPMALQPDALKVPHDEKSEMIVLGSILIDNSILADVTTEINSPGDFLFSRHQYIYAAMLELYAQNKPIERGTLRIELQRKSVFDLIGGDIYITDLVNSTPSGWHGAIYARIVNRLATRRRGLVATDNARQSYLDMDLSTEEAQSNAESSILDVRHRLQDNTLSDNSELMAMALNLLSVDKPATIPTGFSRYDQQLGGGLPRGNLTVIAAPSGMGKTWAGINIALNVAKAMRTDKRKFRVLYFTMEMITETEFLPRVMAVLSGVQGRALRNPGLALKDKPKETAAYSRAIAALGELELFIDDRIAATPAYVRSKVKRYMPDLVVIDYLTLMDDDTPENNRHLRYSSVIRKLKEIAKESGDKPENRAAILVLAQLHRSGINEARGNKNPQHVGDIAPQLESLKESGDIENHAGIVTFLAQDEQLEQQNLIAFVTRKNRFGDEWYRSPWKHSPPIADRNPETGAMACKGLVRLNFTKKSKDNEPF